MNILYLPQNVASMPAITANALNKLDGVKADCLFVGHHKYHNNMGFKSYDSGANAGKLKQVIARVKLLWLAYRKIRKADILHYTWSNLVSKYNIDLRMAKWLRKPIVVEWVGSDIRIPEISAKGSKYYALAFENGYEYRDIESRENSYAQQEKFAKYGATPVLVPEMQLYLKPGLFNKVYTTQYRINSSDFIPYYPDPLKKRPVIVHSPSAKVAKGSNYIMALMDELIKDYDFEFKILHNMPREEVLEIMKTADIFIDQIVLGSYASAAIEAMSYGKPVIAYIMPEVFKMGLPEDCPIINADVDHLKEKIIPLLTDGKLRYELGKRHRIFAEKVHDADVLGSKLKDYYTEIIERNRR